MPGPKDCAAKGLTPGTEEYKKCIAYKGKYAKKGASKPVKGSLKKPAGGGY
jgi:hypothetical protein